MRAALNIGFTLGALLGGVALAFDSDAVIRLVPLFTAVVARSPTPSSSRGSPTPPHDGDADRRRTRAGRPSRAALRNRGFLALIDLRRRARHQPGAAQRGDPAVAGRRRPTPRGCCWPGCSAPTPCSRCCSRCAAARGRRLGRRPSLRAARRQLRLLRALLPDRAGHPRHGRLGHDRAGLARPRDGHRRRAVPVGRPLGASSPSCPTPTGAASTRAPPSLGGTLGSVWAPAALHVAGDRARHARLARHRGDRAWSRPSS